MADLRLARLRPGWRSLETVGWVALYVAAIAGLVSYQASSPMYRAIFLEKTATFWLPEATRDYHVGTPVIGDGPAPYFAGGWWQPADGTIWGDGGRNRLQFLPDVALEAGTPVEIRIGGLVAPAEESEPVSVEVNGKIAAHFDVGLALAEYSFTLPAAVAAHAPLDIVFVVPEASSPVRMGLGPDHRIYGVRLRSISIGEAAHSSENAS